MTVTSFTNDMLSAPFWAAKSSVHSVLGILILMLTLVAGPASQYSVSTVRTPYTARFVVGARKFQHITPVLRDVLHWLPVRQRILYKVAATAFVCIRGTGPA